jgi:hypothetical protein
MSCLNPRGEIKIVKKMRQPHYLWQKKIGFYHKFDSELFFYLYKLNLLKDESLAVD